MIFVLLTEKNPSFWYVNFDQNNTQGGFTMPFYMEKESQMLIHLTF